MLKSRESVDDSEAHSSLPFGKWVGVALRAASVAFLGFGLAWVFVPMLYFYDDGVYFGGALRLASGDRPYVDFYLAHPPGVVWLYAPLAAAGAGSQGCRLLAWAGAGIYLWLSARFFRRVEEGDPKADSIACLGVLFLCASWLFLESSSQVLTYLPGMLLVQLGFLHLLPGRLRPISAGLFLAAASVFRIQFAFIGPAWVVFLLVSSGWKAGGRAAVKLTVTTGLAAAAFHGTMEITHEHYFDCILWSHLGRAPSPFSEKLKIVAKVCKQPTFALGLLASVALAVRGRNAVRGLAAFALTETILIFFGCKFIVGPEYFLLVFPYLMGSASMLVMRLAEGAKRKECLLWLAVAVWAATSGLAFAKKTYYRWAKQWPWEQELIERVRALPGNTVACTPANIPNYAGKRLVSDYFSPDTTSPISPEFQSWFLALARKADIIVLTDEAIARLDRDGCQALKHLGKPLVFGTPEEDADFQRRLEANHLP